MPLIAKIVLTIIGILFILLVCLFMYACIRIGDDNDEE